MNREKTASRVIATTLALMVVLAAFTPFVIGLAAADGHDDGEKGGTIVGGGGNSDAAEKHPSQFNEEGPTLETSYETNQMPPVNQNYEDAARGDVSNFDSIRQDGNGAAKFSPTNGKTAVGVGMYNIPDNNVYTLGIDYEIPEGTTVKVTPVRPTGEPIDNTYVLDGGDSVSNIKLSEEERKYIRQTGEMYLVVTACGDSSQFSIDEMTLVASSDSKSDTGYTEKSALSQEKLACGYGSSGGGNSAPSQPDITIREFGDGDGRIETGEDVRFAADATDPDGDSLTYTWTGAVSTREGNPIMKNGFSSAGEYTITVHASDGKSTTSVSKTFTVYKEGTTSSNNDPSTGDGGSNSGSASDGPSDTTTTTETPTTKTPETPQGDNEYNAKIIKDAGSKIRQYSGDSIPNQYEYAVTVKDQDGLDDGGESVTVEWTLVDERGNVLFKTTKDVELVNSKTGVSRYEVTYSKSGTAGQEGTGESGISLQKEPITVKAEVVSDQQPEGSDDATPGPDAQSTYDVNYKNFESSCPEVSADSETKVGEMASVTVKCEPVTNAVETVMGAVGMGDETVYESNADGGGQDTARINLELGDGRSKTVNVNKNTGSSSTSVSYNEAGTYSITASVIHEKSGGETYKASSTALIVVMPKCEEKQSEDAKKKCKQKKEELQQTKEDLSSSTTSDDGSDTLTGGLQNADTQTYAEAGVEKADEQLDSALTVADSAVDTAVKTTDAAVDTVINAGDSAVDSVYSATDTAVDAGMAAGDAAVDTVTDAAGSAYEFVQDNTGLEDGDAVDQTLSTAANTIDSGVDTVTNTVDNGVDSAMSAGDNFVDTTTSTIDDGVDTAMSAGNTAVDTVTNTVDNGVDAVTDAASNFTGVLNGGSDSDNSSGSSITDDNADGVNSDGGTNSEDDSGIVDHTADALTGEDDDDGSWGSDDSSSSSSSSGGWTSWGSSSSDSSSSSDDSSSSGGWTSWGSSSSDDSSSDDSSSGGWTSWGSDDSSSSSSSSSSSDDSGWSSFL